MSITQQQVRLRHQCHWPSAAEIDAAVAVAKAALPGWANTPPAKRAQVMFKFRELIINNLDQIAELISIQHGKTLDDAKGEVSRGLEVVEFACGIPHLLKGEYSAQVAGAVDSYSLRQSGWCCGGNHAI
jgi:malonate-semialdehyde dehydrogenase (acetylating)/methylmalonate-semialdehyde dehydrogenase